MSSPAAIATRAASSASVMIQRQIRSYLNVSSIYFIGNILSEIAKTLLPEVGPSTTSPIVGKGPNQPGYTFNTIGSRI